jgi:hypothetical protein
VSIRPGSYSVSESGPAGYNASLSSDCAGSIALGQTKTCTITNDDVAQSNGSSTAQSAVLHDSASITNIRALGNAYKVTFRLYKNVSEASPTCNDTTRIFTATRDLMLSATADPALKNGIASTTAMPSGGTTDDGTNVVTANAKYYWTVEMASDQNNVGVVEECGRELTNLTINNNNSN